MVLDRYGSVEQRYVALAYRLSSTGRGFGTLGAVCLWSDSLTFVEFQRMQLLGRLYFRIPRRVRPVGPGDPRTTVRLQYAQIATVSAAGFWKDKVRVVTRRGEQFWFGGSENQSFSFHSLAPELMRWVEAAGHRAVSDGYTVYVDPTPDEQARADAERPSHERQLRRRRRVGLAGALLFFGLIGLGAVTELGLLDDDPEGPPMAPTSFEVGDCLVARGPITTETPCDDRRERKVFKVFHVFSDPDGSGTEALQAECSSHVPGSQKADGSYGFTMFELGGEVVCVQRFLGPPPG